MKCEFTEKISLLIDDELAEQEAGKVRAHLADCPSCRAAQNDFLLLRLQIKELAAETARENNRLPVQIANRQFPFRRGADLQKPIFARLSPAFIALCILSPAFVVLCVLVVSLSLRQPEKAIVGGDSPGKPAILREAERKNEKSLARLDHGGRAEIYVVRRQPNLETSR